jgi:hypothetical protein
VLIDCTGDSGAAETYTAGEHKMAVSHQQKAMSVLWYWETKWQIAQLQPSVFFQQDGAPPHWGLAVIESLN